MPPVLWVVSARPFRAGIARQVILACLLLGVVVPLIVAVQTWGLPFGRTVHIAVDGHELTFRSYRRTVGDALESAQVSLLPGDRVMPARNVLLWPGIHVEVLRAATVTLDVGGRAWPERVAASTVGEALHRLGIEVGPIDRVYPARSAAVRRGMRITVERRQWRTWVEQHALAFDSRVVADPEIYKGNRIVRSAGRDGLTERTVQALYADGRPVTEQPGDWLIVRPAEPRIIAVGTRAMIASRGAFAGHEYMMLDATAYYPGPNNYGGGVGPRTAIGLLAQRGVVAVDPSVIPLGSRVFVEGYGYAIAGDTGGAIQGMRIDLCYNSYDEAMSFGHRTVKVYILDRK
jgi:3D (Asp-Asp-Asp) domain-containing protein